jgi:hypothetical protein
VQINKPLFDILVNMDKPEPDTALCPMMPNEIFSSIEGSLQIDSLKFVNGRLKYSERYAIGSKPAVITFDSIQVLTEGMANHGDSGTVCVIRARGVFMGAGKMNVLMSIPTASKDFSFHYSGLLSGMDVCPINSFLGPAEHIRIAGVIDAAAYDIRVVAGRATGNVRVVYRDLSFAFINKRTGRADGLSDGIASFVANTFRIRGDNVRDESGAVKLGRVGYTRKRNDPFFQFAWFALRSGVGDIVGF